MGRNRDSGIKPEGHRFYMAFFAQFINPAGDVFVQMFILTATSTLVVAVLLTDMLLSPVKLNRYFKANLPENVWAMLAVLLCLVAVFYWHQRVEC